MSEGRCSICNGPFYREEENACLEHRVCHWCTEFASPPAFLRPVCCVKCEAEEVYRGVQTRSSAQRASKHQQKDKALLALLYFCLILAIYLLVARRNESVGARNVRMEIVRNLVDLGAPPFVKLIFPSNGNNQQQRKVIYVKRNSAGDLEYDLTDPDLLRAFGLEPRKADPWLAKWQDASKQLEPPKD